jgi:hypothetical protein
MKRTRGSVRFDPYYKVQWRDEVSLTWRDVQRAYPTEAEASEASALDGRRGLLGIPLERLGGQEQASIADVWRAPDPDGVDLGLGPCLLQGAGQYAGAGHRPDLARPVRQGAGHLSQRRDERRCVEAERQEGSPRQLAVGASLRRDVGQVAAGHLDDLCAGGPGLLRAGVEAPPLRHEDRRPLPLGSTGVSERHLGVALRRGRIDVLIGPGEHAVEHPPLGAPRDQVVTHDDDALMLGQDRLRQHRQTPRPGRTRQRARTPRSPASGRP